MAVTQIQYDTTKPGSAKVAKIRADINRIKGELQEVDLVLDGICDGDTTKTNIEVGGSADGVAMFSVAASSGAGFKDAVTSMRSTFDGISAAVLSKLNVFDES